VSRPPCEVADIVRRHGDRFLETHRAWLTSQHRRVLRALVKAVDICAAEPDNVVRGLVDRGFLKDHDYSLQALREIPYRRWREYDSADTIRFFALRMHEAGMTKSSPQKIIADGMDWRFGNELKKELKG